MKLKAAPQLNTDLFGIFQELKHELYKWNIESVAADAHVSPSTIYFWMAGKTHFPRLDTISRVADAVGFEIRLVKIKGKKKNHLRAVK
jgi:DNA-binding phage protein